MARNYELTWIDKNAAQGPIFKIGRDVYERPRRGDRVIWLPAVETYPGRVAATAVDAFTECAQAWGAPIVFVIDPNLKKPPAARFLFEWSRRTAENGSVEQCFMRTSGVLTRWMGRVVLRLFTDGSMPFETIQGTDAVNARLDQLDLTCPQPGFEVSTPTAALVLADQAPPSMMRSMMRRAARRLRLTR